MDISHLISQLNISDWVRQGHSHLQQSKGVCPFCQREIEEEFKKKLDHFFNEDYNRKISQLNVAISRYSQLAESVFHGIDNLIESNNRFLVIQEISILKAAIDAKYQKNMFVLSQKKHEPSMSVELDSLLEELTLINTQVETANKAIKE